MGVCPVPDNTTGISQDDAGQVAHRNGWFNPYTIHANSGFERGTVYWKEKRTARFETTSDDAHLGALSLAFRKDDSEASALVHESMNYANSDGMQIDAMFHYMKPNSGAVDGDLRLQLLVREVTYTTSLTGCGANWPWPTGKNQNDRLGVTVFVQVKQKTVTDIATTWKSTQTSDYTVPSTWDAADVRVRVRTSLEFSSSGASADAYVDDVRARDLEDR